jgi:hypothetical protein
MLRGIVESHLPVLHSGRAPECPPGVIGRRPGRAEHGTRDILQGDSPLDLWRTRYQVAALWRWIDRG